jgi:ATP-dependent DNA helicase PIF1
LDLPGKPPHNLQLKVGSLFILLRNSNAPRLCNGMRLVIKQLMKNVIEVIILNGKFRGENILLQRISIIPHKCQYNLNAFNFQLDWHLQWLSISHNAKRCLSVAKIWAHYVFHTENYTWRTLEPSNLFELVKEGITKNIVHTVALRDWYCFFTNIVIISDIYNFNGSILINY